MTTASTVLVLEHDESIRELLEVVLSDDGHHVHACETPDELVAAADLAPGSLALVDFWGSSHGYLVDDERRQVARVARAVPTILVTGRVWANERVAEQLGCRAFVPMPFDVAYLSEVVWSWVTRLRADGADTRDHGRAPLPWSAGALDGHGRARQALGRARGITQREEEVAVLIAAGLTNAEIGRRLVVTPGTVANHVEHIRRKLRLRSRTQVAVWAVERGLYRSRRDHRLG